MAAAKILDECIHEKPGSKPSEREGPSKEQGANVSRTPIGCLPQHRADDHQRPPDSNHSQENGPPRHEVWAGRPKTERGDREENQTSETGKEKRIIHRIMDLA